MRRLSLVLALASLLVVAAALDNRTDFDRTMTPFAAGLGGFVSFENPNFVGPGCCEA